MADPTQHSAPTGAQDALAISVMLGELCAASEAAKARTAGLTCPECRSDDVFCEDTAEHHLHACRSCGYETKAAPR